MMIEQPTHASAAPGAAMDRRVERRRTPWWRRRGVLIALAMLIVVVALWRFLPASGSTDIAAVDIETGEVALWGGVAYAGRTFFDEANKAAQPAVATVDLGANAGLGDGFTLRLLARNVGDRIVRTSGYVFGPTQFSTVDVGRRISLTLRRDF